MACQHTALRFTSEKAPGVPCHCGDPPRRMAIMSDGIVVEVANRLRQAVTARFVHS
jgi:hypothetical protein